MDMGAVIQCPKGCGPMEYKTEKNNKVRVFDPIGYVLLIGGLVLIGDSLSGNYDSARTLVGFAVGIGLFTIGGDRTALVTTDLVCAECPGCIVESKGIDERFDKNVAFGLAWNKAEYIRRELSSSTTDSEYDCPDCEAKMMEIRVPYEQDETRRAHLAPDIVEDAMNLARGTSKEMSFDGCKECDLLWFEKKQWQRKLSRETVIIPKP